MREAHYNRRAHDTSAHDPMGADKLLTCLRAGMMRASAKNARWVLDSAELSKQDTQLPNRSKKGAYDDQLTVKGRRFVLEKY